MRRFFVWAVVLLLSPTWADEAVGLEPCQDVFSGSTRCLEEAIRDRLLPLDADAPTPLARIVVLPSFQEEWVVTLYPGRPSARVDLRIASAPIAGRQELCSGSGDAATGRQAVVRSAPVPIDLAEAIAGVWREALLDLDPPRDAWSRGFDGISYHASAWVEGYGPLCGRTWSPTGGIDEQLALLSAGLRAHAEAPSDETEAALRARVSAAAEPGPPLPPRSSVSAGSDGYPVELFSLPPEAGLALASPPLAETLSVSFHVNPFYLNADFDGDGTLDTAVLVRETATQTVGIAVVHGGSKPVVVVGAGVGFANDEAPSDDLAWMDAWQVYERGPVEEGVEAGPPPVLRGDAILSIKSEAASGLIYWTGEQYAWYQQGD